MISNQGGKRPHRNDMEESFSSKTEGGSKGEKLRGSCFCQEKRPINDDEGVDQKFEKLKEKLLMEFGTKDNVSPMLPTSSPFVSRVQLETT